MLITAKTVPGKFILFIVFLLTISASRLVLAERIPRDEYPDFRKLPGDVSLNFDSVNNTLEVILPSRDYIHLKARSLNLGEGNTLRFTGVDPDSTVIINVKNKEQNIISGDVIANTNLVLSARSGLLVTGAGYFDLGSSLAISSAGKTVVTNDTLSFEHFSDTEIIVEGTIDAENVVLTAPYIETNGSVFAEYSIGLVSAGSVEVDFFGNNLITQTLPYDESLPQLPGITHSGFLQAIEKVYLILDAGPANPGSEINLTGTINAGEIIIETSGAAGGSEGWIGNNITIGDGTIIGSGDDITIEVGTTTEVTNTIGDSILIGSGGDITIQADTTAESGSDITTTGNTIIGTGDTFEAGFSVGEGN